MLKHLLSPVTQVFGQHRLGVKLQHLQPQASQAILVVKPHNAEWRNRWDAAIRAEPELRAFRYDSSGLLAVAGRCRRNPDEEDDPLKQPDNKAGPNPARQNGGNVFS